MSNRGIIDLGSQGATPHFASGTFGPHAGREQIEGHLGAPGDPRC